MSESKRKLESLVEYLKTALNKYRFDYEPGQNSYSSGGGFANGFFKHPKIKIVLIFRDEKLGSVNYEIMNVNVSHDMFINGIKRGSEQKLFYDTEGFCSYTLNNQKISEALLHDLETIILPFVMHASPEGIKSLIQKERDKMWN